MTLTKRRVARLFAGLSLIALVATALAACTVQGRGFGATDQGPVIWSVNLSGGPQFAGSIRFVGPKLYFISTGDVYYDVGGSSGNVDVVDGSGVMNGRNVNFTLSYNEQTGFTTFDATGTGPNSDYQMKIKGDLIPKVQIKD